MHKIREGVKTFFFCYNYIRGDKMNNFVFNRRNSFEDMGLIILKGISRQATYEEIESVEVEGRIQGSLTIKTESYKDIEVVRTVRIPTFEEYTVKSAEINKWLNEIEDNRLYFEDEPNKCYTVKYVKTLVYNDENRLYTDLTITFVCEPFMRVTNEFEMIVANNENIYNDGDVISEPILYLNLPDLEQNIQITINDRTIELRNVKGNVTIDTTLFIALNNNLIIRTIGDFPILEKGNNTISWVGDINELKIKKNIMYRSNV